MSATTDPRPASSPPPPTDVVRVTVPQRSLRSELRAIKIVWKRELIRYFSDRLRIVTALVQPLLFLFVLGAGLEQLSSASTDGVAYKTIIYPGILAISVLFTAMFSAATIVWDREYGFLREMMVAPVRRSSIVIGKCLGGATVAGTQGVIVLCLAGAVNVPYNPVMLIELLILQLLLAFAITAFGVMIAIRIKQMQSFMGITQMVMTPMMFISGALFPVASLPLWLAVLNRFDPLTYAVDPMRRIVFQTSEPLPGGSADARSGGHVVRLAGADTGRGGCHRGARAGDAQRRDLGVQLDRVARHGSWDARGRQSYISFTSGRGSTCEAARAWDRHFFWCSWSRSPSRLTSRTVFMTPRTRSRRRSRPGR